MLNKIIAFSLRNRALVVLATLILIIGGCWTAKNMEVDVFPDLNAPTVVIMTEAKGMAAEEVERLVTFPHRDRRQRCHRRAPRALFEHDGILRGVGGI